MINNLRFGLKPGHIHYYVVCFTALSRWPTGSLFSHSQGLRWEGKEFPYTALVLMKQLT